MGEGASEKPADRAPTGGTTSPEAEHSPHLSSWQLRKSVREVADRREDIQTLYYIADQLSRSIEPDVMRRRAVEMASTIFGSRCVLLAGHFASDSTTFHGTVTYWENETHVVERPYPDPNVEEAVSFYDPVAVNRWRRGELSQETRTGEGTTVAFPLVRHGRRLGLILTPASQRDTAKDGRATAASPEVARAWIMHLGVALELAELQRQRVRQERLAAIGETVAGLSHCLKNTLNGLQGGQYVLDQGLRKGDRDLQQQGWRMVKEGIRHIGALSLDMLSFAGDRPIQREAIEPRVILEEVHALLAETAREMGIALALAVDPLAEPVSLDRHAVHRALLNLVTNAIDACVESDAGDKVTLGCRYEPDGVVMTVEDDGTGIPDSILSRITERFFTTKPTKGTGLGLPVVQRIMEQHGGLLEVESTLGCGSTFSLWFPREPGARAGE